MFRPQFLVFLIWLKIKINFFSFPRSLHDPTTGQTEPLDSATDRLTVGEKSYIKRETTLDSLPCSLEDLHESRSDSVFANLSSVSQFNEADHKVGHNLSTSEKSLSVPTVTKTTYGKSGKSAWNGTEDKERVKPRSALKSLTHSDYVDDQEGGATRRLLPNCKNSLHIIDGPQYRYFVGIIDFLTVYGFYQKLDSLRKNIKYSCGDHSTVPPVPYAKRFQQFIQERTN